MLAAWVDGKLAEDDRRGIEDHVSRCQDCYFVVRETATAAAESQPPRARPRPWATRALPIAAVLVLGVGGFALWRQGHPADPYARAVGPLVEAVGERRFFEPRLTGGFKYGPMVSPTRSADLASQSENWGVLAEKKRVLEKAEGRSDLVLRHAVAAAELLAGDPEMAIRQLEALAPATADAEAFADLAAAYLVRAARANQPKDYERARDAAAKALARNPRLTEALFNKALALQGLGAPDEATAWKTYLEIDPHSPWAAEAKARLAHLERKRPDPPGR